MEGTRAAAARWPAMFFFFSNRMGCLGSLLLSVLGTLLILFLLGWL
ncbi:MAG TPA: hypothetical protein VEY69_13110 [Lautropia sp.]|nr:hypothetical protein [Lautropia sp.]